MQQRKNDHIELALKQPHVLYSPFSSYTFTHNALPEIDYAAIDTSVMFLGEKLDFPLLIASMTGGTEKAKKLNQQLATLCQKYGLALGVGSQRVALETPTTLSTFQVRKYAPDILLFANLGAVQLNYGYTKQHLQEALNMIGADALFLHLNPLQEAIQPEGTTNFKDLLPKIKAMVASIKKPIFVKEVGNGVSTDVAKRLHASGVTGIATEGTGGTNWAYIEGQRGKTTLGETFHHWGIPTPESIQACAKVRGLKVIGGGGLRTGIDIAKALALGADLASIGKALLEQLIQSPEKAEAYLEQIKKEFTITLFCLGCQSVDELKKKGKKLLRKQVEKGLL